jgi:hypothetical protein
MTDRQLPVGGILPEKASFFGNNTLVVERNPAVLGKCDQRIWLGNMNLLMA